MTAFRYNRYPQGRDPFPVRVAIVTVSLLILLVGALVWGSLGGQEGVRVADPESASTAAAAERRADADNALPAPSDPVTTDVVSGGSSGPAPSAAAPPAPEDSAPAPGRATPEAISAPALAQPAPAITSGAERTVAPPVPPRTAEEPARPAGAERVAPPDPAAGELPRGEPPAAPSRTTDISSAMVADALHREGVYRLETGALPEAVDRLERAVDLSPLHPVYRNNYGWALFRAGDVEGAAEQLEHSIRLGPERAIPHANLAEVRLAQGDTASALAAYLRFLELNDDPALERDANRRIAEIRR